MTTKKFLLCTSLAVTALCAYAKNEVETIFTLSPQMSCQNCENKIKSNLRFEKGVKNIQTSLSEQQVVVTYNPDKTDADKLKEAFTKIGYEATVVTPEETTVQEK